MVEDSKVFVVGVPAPAPVVEPDVLTVHEALEAKGFAVADVDEVDDGVVGPSTRAALTEFQYSVGRGGMDAIGQLDEETLEALLAEEE